MNRLNSIKNYYFPTGEKTTDNLRGVQGSSDVNKNLSRFIVPLQFQRLRQDINSWREAVKEAELPYYPHRVKMQRLFIDTVQNGHVASCMSRRHNLTLLRDFKICDEKGTPSEDLKSIFRNNNSAIDSNEKSSSWFDDFIRFCLESEAYGNSLISLGDIINNSFPEICSIKRWNVSPDRYNVSAFPYSVGGENFLEDPFKDWHIYVSTPSENGISPCGYGYLYKIAYNEILLRNTIGYNMDFIEVFNQPLRVGTTDKQGDERDEFEGSLRNMGQMAYVVIDSNDKIEFKDSASVGSSYQSYDNFCKRMEAIITRVILGHSDALTSIPGQLGNQSGDDNPITKALLEIQSTDGIKIQNIVNNKLLPRMRKLGFKIPINYHFEYLNDREKQAIRMKEDESNLKTAQIAVQMRTAGMKMDSKYFQERTGIPTSDIQLTNDVL